jgi:hypothetical protein
VPANSEPVDVLLAIATDLLAQSEAQHRIAIRLEHTLRQLLRDTRQARERGTVAPAVELVREQLHAIRDVVDAERALLDEIEREIAGASQ